MRALQLVAAGHPLELREVPEPAPQPGEVALRVVAAGICRSDVHYRAGSPRLPPVPVTLGHEVAGIVEETGSGVGGVRVGDRVAVHYQLSCGHCRHCREGNDQLCSSGAMIGNHRDGGFADRLVIPARNAVPVPARIDLAHAAVMMCSTATSLHALRRARLAPGESVAVFGLGGLGMSAVQLARLEGAGRVFAVDLNPDKIARAAGLGATPVDAGRDPVATIKQATEGRGVDVALELVGVAATIRGAIEVLAPHGRAAMVGLNDRPVPLDPYGDLVLGERVLVGVSDHLAPELAELMELARAGDLDLEDVVTDTIPLEAGSVNDALDRLERFGDAVRTVILPGAG